MPCSTTVGAGAARVPHQGVEVGDVHQREVVPVGHRVPAAGRRPARARCARGTPPARPGRGCGRSQRLGQLELLGPLQHDHVDSARRPAARARPRPRRPASPRPRAGRRPTARARAASGAGSGARPWTNAVVQEPCTCQIRMFTMVQGCARQRDGEPWACVGLSPWLGMQNHHRHDCYSPLSKPRLLCTPRHRSPSGNERYPSTISVSARCGTKQLGDDATRGAHGVRRRGQASRRVVARGAGYRAP